MPVCLENSFRECFPKNTGFINEKNVFRKYHTSLCIIARKILLDIETKSE
jgi:hypothetical protein